MTSSAKLQQYLIERELPGTGNLNNDQLHEIASRSCTVLEELGPDIQWVYSYVTGDKIYCVYEAANTDLIREHADRGDFPADSIRLVRTVIDPSMGN